MLYVIRLILTYVFLIYSWIRIWLVVLVLAHWLPARSMLIINCAHSLRLLRWWCNVLLPCCLLVIEMACQVDFRLDLIWIILNCAVFLHSNGFLLLCLSQGNILNLSSMLIDNWSFNQMNLLRLAVGTKALLDLLLNRYLGRRIFLVLNCPVRTAWHYHRLRRISGLPLLQAMMVLLV